MGRRKRWIRMELGLLMMGAESPVGRRVVPVAVGREGSERFVEAAGSGRQTTTGWTVEEGQPRHRQRRPGRRLVAVAAALDREGSKRLAVVAAGVMGVMVVQRRRWIGMEQMMGAFKTVALKEPTGHRTLKSGWR